jgi:hypothetical protein
MNRTIPLILAASIVISAGAVAQPIVVAPFGGWRFVGNFEAAYGTQLTSLKYTIENDFNFGVVANVGLTPEMQLELLWDRQSSRIKLRDDNPANLPDEVPTSVPLKTDYYHAGFLVQRPYGQATPFVVATLGATTFYPDAQGADNRTRFSFGFAVGTKTYLSQRIGFRLQSRFMFTSLGTRAEWWCDPFGCFAYDRVNWLTQIDLSAGLMYRIR